VKSKNACDDLFLKYHQDILGTGLTQAASSLAGLNFKQNFNSSSRFLAEIRKGLPELEKMAIFSPKNTEIKANLEQLRKSIDCGSSTITSHLTLKRNQVIMKPIELMFKEIDLKTHFEMKSMFVR
jgi:lipid II:glycine glycyltransferase (peptidoglycan interpeptide bridge formation enzyme)